MDPAIDQKPTYDQLEAEVERLRFENNNLKRLIFGQKRERFVSAQNDSQLDFLDTQTDKAAPSQPQTKHISYTRKKRGKSKPPSRGALPAHLPRKDILIKPDSDVTGMKKIGEEITEELEYDPGKLFVNRYIRPKYARPKGEGVVIGLLPTRPIEKGIAGPGLLAHLTISKYVDHLPLYRQQQQFKRQGVELAESTLCGWIKASYDLILPLAELIEKQILQSTYLMVDETTIKVQDPLKKGTTHLGYYWVYYDPLHPRVFFNYQKGRSRDGPNTILKNFAGFLQTDGYKGYNDLALKPDITALGCMAHARRYFVEAEDSDPERASWMLHHLQILYAIERYARENQLSFELRYQERQKSAVPVMNVIKDWLNVESRQVLPKSLMGKAIAYMLNHWDRLEIYLTEGRLEIDNNLVENAIRPIALGRKNYLFAGSHKGAKRAAAIYTIVANAKLQGVEPFVYLRDVLNRIPDHPYKKLDQLLPENWKKQYLSA